VTHNSTVSKKSVSNSKITQYVVTEKLGLIVPAY
jgi:hypothetical protein